jgi:hypothetical protein
MSALTLGDRVTSVQSKLLKLGQREGKLWLITDKTSTTKEPILAVVTAAQQACLRRGLEYGWVPSLKQEAVFSSSGRSPAPQ